MAARDDVEEFEKLAAHYRQAALESLTSAQFKDHMRTAEQFEILAAHARATLQSDRYDQNGMRKKDG